MLQSLFEFQFLQNAFITGILVGFIAPLLGVFIVVRRLSLIADALSHITLAGIAVSMFANKKIAFLQGIHPVYMGIAFSIIGALFIEKLRKEYAHYKELAIPILLSGGVGIAVIFIALADGFSTDLFSFLFGSVTAVSRLDLWIIVAITIVVTAIVILFYKEFFVLSFDEEHAVVSGVKAKLVNFIFIVLVALVITASMRIVGILLVSSLMTLPVAASIRLAKGFKQALLLSIVFGETSVVFGLIGGYYLNIPPGGTIVIIAIAILIAAILTGKYIRNHHSKGASIHEA